MLEKAKRPSKTDEQVAELLEQVEIKKPATTLTISAPNFQSAKVRLIGKTPLVVNKMSALSRQNIMKKQLEGSRSRKGQKRDPKDFDAVYKGAMHISEEGWQGFPASALRAGLISACRLVGFKMTIAKLSVFVEGDGIDNDDGQPLIKIIGKPIRRDLPVKLADGSTDILPRPFFFPWEMQPTLTWDADQFSAEDVLNLLARVGRQVGVGAGRPDSKNSTGMGWGTFQVES